LAQALGVRGPARQDLARRAYATMGANFLETFTAQGVDGIESHVEIANPAWADAVQRRVACQGDGGLVLLTLHLGSWDGCIIGGKRGFGRVLAYAKDQGATDAILNACRECTGAEILITSKDERSTGVRALRAVRGGAAIGLLADQKPRAEEGVPAWFLGQAVRVHPGPAFFAHKGPARLVPAFALRVASGRTRVYLLRDEAPAATQAATTQRAMDVLSALIAAIPGQYFWHHRRFRDVPDPPPPLGDARWRQGLAWLRGQAGA
jgi:lauroyl/myristoyl acyltransferase